MANLYGVSNPLILPVIVTPGSNVVLTAGTETTFMSSTSLVAISSGFFYPIIWLTVSYSFGASLPTALAFNFKLGAGSDVDTQAVNAAAFVASTYYQYTCCLVGVASQVAWQSPGSVINITGLSTTNLTQSYSAGTRAVIGLFRAPDQ